MATEAEITSMVEAEHTKGDKADQCLFVWGIRKKGARFRRITTRIAANLCSSTLPGTINESKP